MHGTLYLHPQFNENAAAVLKKYFYATAARGILSLFIKHYDLVIGNRLLSFHKLLFICF